jgi:hypothetical protein
MVNNNSKNRKNRIRIKKKSKVKNNKNLNIKTKKFNNKSKKNHKNIFKPLNCSPHKENKILKYSCYSEIDLQLLRNIWNSRHPDKPILTKNPHSIWSILRLYYSEICNKESCWVRQMVKDKNIEKQLLESFAPVSPASWKKNPNEWLSSIDILRVMNQYEKKYKCFEFLGPSPINYDTIEINGKCVWDEICTFNLQSQIEKGKHKTGIIFNTDPDYKSGEHWISLFINAKSSTIFFFDSAGQNVPEEIFRFVKNVQQQGKNMSPQITFIFDQNYPVEHQYNDTECGIYSIFFITHMLQDKINGQYLKTHILNDEYIEQFRKIYFNDEL